MAGGIIENDQEVYKRSAKIAVDSQKLLARKILLDVFLALLASVCLCLAVQILKAIKSILDFISFINEFAEVVADLSIPEIVLLSKLNTRLVSK